MTITNKEFSNILSLVIQELIFLEQQERQEENYYQEMTELIMIVQMKCQKVFIHLF